MNRGTGKAAHLRIGGQHGYTIVEVLIFLAVSAVLFVSTMLVLSGRQQRVQFTNAVRDFETKIVDVANDVSNGYYQSAGNVQCTAGNPPVVNVGPSNTQGTNDGCVILGRIIKFGFDGNVEQYGTYSIVGNRLNAGTDVSDLADASPRVLLTSDVNNNRSLREQLNVGSGTRVSCIRLGSNPCVPNSNAAIAFITRLNGSASVGADGNGITADIYRFASATVNQSENDFRASADSLLQSGAAMLNSDTLTVCLESGGTNQYALVRILNGRVLSEIKELSGGPLCS